MESEDIDHGIRTDIQKAGGPHRNTIRRLLEGKNARASSLDSIEAYLDGLIGIKKEMAVLPVSGAIDPGLYDNPIQEADAWLALARRLCQNPKAEDREKVEPLRAILQFVLGSVLPKVSDAKQ